jgi:LCP family protein required for cell wall assembly
MRNPFKKKAPDPFAASRYEGMLKGGRIHERHRPWLFRHTWAWVSLLVIILLGGAGGYGLYFYYHLQGKVQEDVPGVRPGEEDQPFNVLLIGSDSREGLTEEEKLDFGAADVGGERADTIIIAHIDPEANHVTMVQFPRDLYVPIPSLGSNKINAALLGGKAELVKTVSDLTGIEINNYAQVNIAGFRDVVDAIGGVDICISEPVPFDSQTGIEVTQEEIDESPLIHFDGERALRFVRSRNFPTGDFERIRNQQRFLSAAIDKALNVGMIFDLGKVKRLADAAGDNLRVDKGTDLRELIRIAQRFRSFDPENYEAYTAPNLGTARNEAGSVVLPDLEALGIMFNAIEDNESPAEATDIPNVDVSTINVGVYNGTLEDGVAAAAAEELKTATTIVGETISVVDVANADNFNVKEPFIRYDPANDGARLKAQLIAAAIPGVEIKKGETPVGVDVEVVVGSRPFKTQKIVQINPIPLPKPGETPEGCR